MSDQTLHFLLLALCLLVAAAPDARAQQYVVDTQGAGSCNNVESDDDECDDGVCMAYDGQGNPIGCTLQAALQETAALGGGTVTFASSGTFDAGDYFVLGPGVQIDGGGHDVTLVAQSQFGVAPAVLMAMGDNTITGVTAKCMSGGQVGIIVNAGAPVQISGAAADESVRVTGCMAGISIGAGLPMTLTNVVLVGNDEGLNMVTSGEHRVENSFIGVEADGFTPNPNGVGVKLMPGASSVFEGNVISGNTQSGVQFVGGIEGVSLEDVRFSGNFIGVAPDSTTPIPNGQAGIVIHGPSRDVVIGESLAGVGRPNVIAHNGAAGIQLNAFEDLPGGRSGAPLRTTIRRNRIAGNGGLGLAATASTVLPDRPVLDSLVTDTTGVAADTLYGHAAPEHLIDVYLSDAPPDESGAGEGERWIDSVATDSNGVFRLAVPDAPAASSCGEARAFTATATDEVGTTSLFADNLFVLSGAVRPQFREIFLKDVEVQNTFTVVADWGSTPQAERVIEVRINEDDPWKRFTDVPDAFTFQIDMGGGGNTLAARPDNEIEVRLNGCHDAAVSEVLTVPVVEVPAWVDASEIDVLPQDDHVRYRRSWKMPEEPIEASVTVPDEVPFWSGLWGLDATQFETRFEASSLGGETEGDIEGSSRFGLGPKLKIAITAEGTTQWSLTPQELGPFTGTLDLTASGSGSIGERVCLPTPFGLDVGCVEGRLDASLGLTYTAPFVYEQDDVMWQSGTGEAAPSLTGTVEASISFPVSAGFGVTVQGDALVDFGPPDDLSLSGNGQVQMTPHVTVLDEKYSVEIELFEFSFGGGASAYEPPVVFVAKASQTPVGVVEGVRAAVPPALAATADGTRALAAVVAGDDGHRDIIVRFSDEEGWGPAVHVTADAARDLDPVLAFDDSGRLLVVWMRSEAVPPSTLDGLATYAQTYDLAYAVVDPTSRTVVESGALTDDDRADLNPRLVRGTDGSVLLAWASAASVFTGSAEAPLTVRTQLWSGVEWGASEVAADGLAGVSSWDVAHYRAGASLLAFTTAERDAEAERELSTVTRVSGVWQNPQTLTNDAVRDDAVHAAYRPDGAPVLVWARDTLAVTMTAGADTEPDSLFTLGAASGRTFASGAFVEAGGRLVLAWPGSERPHYVADSLGTWTGPLPVPGRDEPARAVAVAGTPAAEAYVAALDYSGGAETSEIAVAAVDLGEAVSTSIDEPSAQEPAEAFAFQAYPTPAQGPVTAELHLTRPADIRVSLVDVLGRTAAVLAEGRHAAGTHRIRFETRPLAAGIYFVVLRHEGQQHVRTIMVMR